MQEQNLPLPEDESSHCNQKQSPTEKGGSRFWRMGSWEGNDREEGGARDWPQAEPSGQRHTEEQKEGGASVVTDWGGAGRGREPGGSEDTDGQKGRGGVSGSEDKGRARGK